MTSPLIGVTPSVGINELGIRTFSIASDYTLAIQRAGGIPVILPLHIAEIEILLGSLGGIVFSGGGDIDPALFNQEQHPTLSGIDEERDRFEIALMKAAFARDMPILAICRGVQVMNVERGGDLIQDIPSQTDSKREHGQRAVGAEEHDVFQQAEVEPGENPVTNAVGTGTLDINSFHHQALGAVPTSLEVVARSDDGIVEAVYSTEHTFAVGTQWHPERLAAAHKEHQALFDNLVESAKVFAQR